MKPSAASLLDPDATGRPVFSRHRQGQTDYVREAGALVRTVAQATDLADSPGPVAGPIECYIKSLEFPKVAISEGLPNSS
jgi:hypothetical protein